jgi:hypothetical protein
LISSLTLFVRLEQRLDQKHQLSASALAADGGEPVAD